MSKRKPYTVSFPEKETRSALVLLASRVKRLFTRGETQTLMITDDEAENLRRDGWGVASASASDPALDVVLEPASTSTSTDEPRPRRRRREG